MTNLPITIKETHYLPPLLSEQKSTWGLAPAVAIGLVIVSDLWQWVFVGDELKISGFDNLSYLFAPSKSAEKDPIRSSTHSWLGQKHVIVLVIFLAITFVTILILCLLWMLWKLL